MCTNCKWQGAKNVKFPTKTRRKNNESYFSCERLLCLQKGLIMILATLATGSLENEMWKMRNVNERECKLSYRRFLMLNVRKNGNEKIDKIYIYKF